VLSPIRVLVRDVPPLVRDVLEHAFDGAPDMELIAENGAARRAAGPVVPDAVIVAAEEASVIDIDRFLAHWPKARVVVLRLDGRGAVLYELRLFGSRLGDLSPAELLDAIRAAVRQHKS